MITAKDFKLIDATPERVAELNEALVYLQKNAPKNAIPLLKDAVASGVSIRFSDKQDPVFHPVKSENAPVDENIQTMARTVNNKHKLDFTANSIDWDPHKTLIFTNATHSESLNGDEKGILPQGAISSALLLAHELKHAVDYKKNPKQFDINNAVNSDAQFGTTNEKNDTTGVEREIAKELHEHQRKNHGMYRYLDNGRPTLHTIPDKDPNATILKWQEQHLAGTIVVTGGVFDKEAVKHNTENKVPDLGSYNTEAKTYTGNNVNIALSNEANGLTLKGDGNTLNLSKDISVTTEGKFTVHFGKDGQETKEVSGKTQLTTHDGKLEAKQLDGNITTPNSASQPHAESTQGYNYHQLGRSFEYAIKNPDPQDPHLISLAHKHNELIGSIAFYNAASKQLPEPVVNQIGNNLVGEIKEGRLLQEAVNKKVQMASSEMVRT